MIIIIAISTAGALLLVLNLALVTCYLIRRRKKKCMEEGQFKSHEILLLLSLYMYLLNVLACYSYY